MKTFKPTRPKKKILVLEEQPYRYQATLSDIAGCDIKAHNDDHLTAMDEVRGWLIVNADADSVGGARIRGKYNDFQEWNYEKQLSEGFSEDDIKKYDNAELLLAMKKWKKLGEAASYN